MTQQLWVPGKLPGMNELIGAAKGFNGRGYAYAKLKREWTDSICVLALAARLQPVGRARLRFTWREATRRRDPDNVCAGGRKLILDALVKADVLSDDGWDEIVGWEDRWEVGQKPGVLVEIEACGS